MLYFWKKEKIYKIVTFDFLSMKKIFLLLVAVAWCFSGCEKDDICDANTATTPRLIIDFYDVTNPTIPKNVTHLAVIGEGLTTYIEFDNVSKIQLPLKTTADLSKYKFIINYGNTTNPEIVNEDQLQFNYTRNNIFVSRACGFKTTYILNTSSPFVLTDAAIPDNLWIKSVTLVQSNILNENETHLKISH